MRYCDKMKEDENGRPRSTQVYGKPTRNSGLETAMGKHLGTL